MGDTEEHVTLPHGHREGLMESTWGHLGLPLALRLVYGVLCSAHYRGP